MIIKNKKEKCTLHKNRCGNLKKVHGQGTRKHGADVTDRAVKRKAPLSNDNGALSGELGTRTPDPLRVMQDDFSFFRTMIR